MIFQDSEIPKNDLRHVEKFKHAFWNAETHPFLQLFFISSKSLGIMWLNFYKMMYYRSESLIMSHWLWVIYDSKVKSYRPSQEIPDFSIVLAYFICEYITVIRTSGTNNPFYSNS